MCRDSYFFCRCFAAEPQKYNFCAALPHVQTQFATKRRRLWHVTKSWSNDWTKIWDFTDFSLCVLRQRQAQKHERIPRFRHVTASRTHECRFQLPLEHIYNGWTIVAQMIEPGRGGLVFFYWGARWWFDLDFSWVFCWIYQDKKSNNNW